jgi:uridine phosphorylase
MSLQYATSTDYPILEFDPASDALIEPSRVLQKQTDFPEHCVLCFFQEVITQFCGEGKGDCVYNLGSEIGTNPVYEINYQGKRMIVAHPGVGAPLAGGFLEELIALGCTKFIACGGAGVLNREIAVGHVVVPSRAVRDEGTSYHYLPPSREIDANAQGVTAIEAALQKHHVPYVIERRRAEGCITVEMEAAAFFAIAQFRGVTFGQILYGGDDISGDEWDHRGWQTQLSSRAKLFELAAEACLSL